MLETPPGRGRLVGVDMADRTCLYCGSVIVPGKRGVPLDRRSTCAAKECRRLHHNAINKLWREANKESHRAQIKAWRIANKAHVRAVNRAWLDANRARQYEVNRRWNAANRDRHRDLVRDWERRNPIARAGYRLQRRGWKQGGVISTADWSRLVERYGSRCAYCSQLRPLTVDHVIPLSRGGRHTIGNVLPACRPCNSAKQDKLLVEWRARRCRGRGRTTSTRTRPSGTR